MDILFHMYLWSGLVFRLLAMGSLVMVGLQALGYVLPLITDAEILVKWNLNISKFIPKFLNSFTHLSKSSTTPQNFVYWLRFCLLHSFCRRLQHLIKDHMLLDQQRSVFQVRSWFSWSGDFSWFCVLAFAFH